MAYMHVEKYHEEDELPLGFTCRILFLFKNISFKEAKIIHVKGRETFA